MNIMKTGDLRIKLLNEVLMGIRVVKYYCWEKPFKLKIEEIRKKEIHYHKVMTLLMSTGIELVMTLVPQIVPLVCFSIYPSVMGKPLVSSVAFTSISLFNTLQMPFAMMPMCMMLLVQFTVSIRRISNFLNLEEVDPLVVERNLPAGSKPTYVTIDKTEKTVDGYAYSGWLLCLGRK